MLVGFCLPSEPNAFSVRCYTTHTQSTKSTFRSTYIKKKNNTKQTQWKEAKNQPFLCSMLLYEGFNSCWPTLYTHFQKMNFLGARFHKYLSSFSFSRRRVMGWCWRQRIKFWNEKWRSLSHNRAHGLSRSLVLCSVLPKREHQPCVY